MKSTVSILLVHNGAGPVPMLESAFSGSPVTIRHSRTCGEARTYLLRPDPPHLVFTETSLPDGTWDFVVAQAREAAQSVNVIIVAANDDPHLSAEAIERGAFDFIAPPFADDEFYQVVRRAIGDILSRRKAENKSLAHISRRQLPSEQEDPVSPN